MHKKEDERSHTSLLQESIPEPAPQTLPISVSLPLLVAMTTLLRIRGYERKLLIDEVGDFALDIGYVPTV